MHIIGGQAAFFWHKVPGIRGLFYPYEYEFVRIYEFLLISFVYLYKFVFVVKSH